MPYEVFEGEKTLEIMSKRVEGGDMRDDFDEIKETFGFSKDVESYALCVSIALRKLEKEENLEMEPLPDSTKLVDLTALDDKKLFDILLMEYLDEDENRLGEFQKLFYGGFKIVREWLHKNEPETEPKNELHKISDLYHYIEGEE